MSDLSNPSALDTEPGRTQGSPSAVDFDLPAILADSCTEEQADFQRATDRIIVARYGPPAVVITEDLDVVGTRGDTSPFLMLPHGTASPNLLRLAKESLGPSLRAAVHRAIKDDSPAVIHGIRLHKDAPAPLVTIEVLPIKKVPHDVRRFLVVFLLTHASTPGRDITAELRPEDLVAQKPREVSRFRNDETSRMYLQALIEDRDFRNQELITANEQVQSSNEELQSISEELETAKEELQSSNEELQTVNEELNRKNEQLSQTTADLNNLLTNITMPVLIVGADLHIRQFTPLAERILSVHPTDLGRHIRETRLNVQVEDLEPMLQHVLDTLETKELEVRDRDGNWNLLRAKPYRSMDSTVDGVVVVLIDIQQIRHIQEELREARDFALAIIESVHIPLAVLNADLNVSMANRAFLGMVELPLSQVAGHPFADVAGSVWGIKNIRPMLLNVLRHKAETGGFAIEHNFGQDRTVLVHAQAIKAGDGPGVLVAVDDVTSRKQAQRLLMNENERLEGRVQSSEVALQRSNEELRKLTERLFTAQEEESRRIARDLHDDLTQRLALLEMNVEQMEQTAESGPMKGRLAQLHVQATELLEGLRRVAHEMHPHILDDLGLGVALERLIQDFEQHDDLPVRLTIRAFAQHAPPAVALCLYRIAQEALHNALKHARGSPVEISLECVDDVLQLRIQDSGNGFDVADVRLQGKGLGIISMQERVRLIGGTFSIRSKTEEGTTVEVGVPLPPGNQVCASAP